MGQELGHGFPLFSLLLCVTGVTQAETTLFHLIVFEWLHARCLDLAMNKNVCSIQRSEVWRRAEEIKRSQRGIKRLLGVKDMFIIFTMGWWLHRYMRMLKYIKLNTKYVPFKPQ